MRLRNLFEATTQEVAIMFGRFNPPHFGHVDAWKVADNFSAWVIGTNQSTEGPKDPLPFDIKIQAMKVMYPAIEGHLVAEQSWFTLAVKVYEQHGENTILHVVTDPADKDIYVPMIQKQNGKDGNHGFYNFKDIVWQPAERKSEASLVRKAVKENNPEDFAKYSGVPANTKVAGKNYFDLVRQYMLPYMQADEEKAKQKAESDAAKQQKEADNLKKQQDRGQGQLTKSNQLGQPIESVVEGGVEDLEKDLKNPHSYDAIDHMMQTIAQATNVTPKELHDQFVEKHGITPDEWIEKKKTIAEATRMSAAIKLQRAWDRQRAKSDSSHERMRRELELIANPPNKDEPKKDITEDIDAQFDMIEDMVESLAEEHGVDAEIIWEDFDAVSDEELLETAAWRRSAGKSKSGGLNAKGVASYRRENPGSKLQTAVTTKPSKLKKGSKAAKRRKSFCARMGGVKGPMKKPNGDPTRKALALRKWNC